MTTRDSQRKAWKRNERQIAAVLGNGAERVPVSGRQRGDQPDIRHPFLSIEAKLRNRLPTWLHDAMKQAEASMRGRQTATVILREKGSPVGEAYVIFRLEEFTRRFVPESVDD